MAGNEEKKKLAAKSKTSSVGEQKSLNDGENIEVNLTEMQSENIKEQEEQVTKVSCLNEDSDLDSGLEDDDFDDDDVFST